MAALMRRAAGVVVPRPAVVVRALSTAAPSVEDVTVKINFIDEEVCCSCGASTRAAARPRLARVSLIVFSRPPARCRPHPRACHTGSGAAMDAAVAVELGRSRIRPSHNNSDQFADRRARG